VFVCVCVCVCLRVCVRSHIRWSCEHLRAFVQTNLWIHKSTHLSLNLYALYINKDLGAPNLSDKSVRKKKWREKRRPSRMGIVRTPLFRHTHIHIRIVYKQTCIDVCIFMNTKYPDAPNLLTSTLKKKDERKKERGKRENLDA